MTKPNETHFCDPRNLTIAEKLADLDAGGSIKLLVSVRDLSEMMAVIAAQVDVVDLKEPRNGPLAPVDPVIWKRAARSIAPPAGSERLSQDPTETPLLSAALGETSDARRIADQVPRSFAFAKVGPSGCTSPTSLRRTWDQIRRLLPDHVELVAVAYADWQQAESLSPECVFEQAAKAGLRRCLVDTFHKNAVSTLEHLGNQQLRHLSAVAVENGIWWTMAGSIKLEHLPRLMSAHITPNCIGVRGDVCEKGREGIIQLDRVKAWQNALNEYPAVIANRCNGT